MGTQRPGILLLASDPFFGGDVAAVNAHMAAGDRAFEPVAGHHVFQHPVAHAVSAARLAQQVRRVCHALHAACQDDVVVAGADQGFGEGHGPHAGAADAVDSLRWHVDADARPQGDLPRRILPGSSLQHLANNGVADVFRRDARALDGGPRRDDAEIDGALARECAVQPAERRARAAENDHAGRLF